MALVKIENLERYFGEVAALAGVNFNFKEGEQYAIAGASGSGKSTLLYLMGGLDRPTSGRVLVEDQDLSKKDDQKLAQFRNEFVGFVFQFHFLLKSMNCLNNIFLPARIRGANLPKSFVADLAKRLDVEHCLNKYPYEISGGEQQRINIIRALSLKPKLLLCDEPTGNLDSENSNKVISMLKELANDFNSTLVVVTHDAKIVDSFEHKIIMQDGSIVN